MRDFYKKNYRAFFYAVIFSAIYNFFKPVLLGIPFLITNNRKGGFLTLSANRSLIVCPYNFVRVCLKSFKNTRFTALRVFTEKKLNLAKANDRKRT